MNIKVCDALCGSGKTSACIRMMNSDTDSKFIFVTQFLSEVDRIVTKCKARHFITPDGDLQSGKTKLVDIVHLLEEGRNIATTHSLFVSCTDEIKEIIRKQKYVLVLDETVDIMQMSGMKMCDVNLLIRNNALEEHDGRLKWIDDIYEKEDSGGDGKFSQEILLSKSRNLLKFDDEYYFWSLPPELFGCFKSVYVLTYMFHAQLLRCFFDLYRLPYEMIGVRKIEDHYEFCDAGEMNRARDLRDKIHILEHKKLNEIGARRGDLSYSSYELGTHKLGNDLTERMRKNLVNLFRNVYHASSNDTMWTAFKNVRGEMTAKGFGNSFVPYNKRASNEYGNRHYLAYCVNNFLRPWESRYYKQHGVNMDQDSYALSFLVQWVFRSAIRNGEEVWVYIPSARMRNLFYQWLENLAAGDDLTPVIYKSRRRHIVRGAREKTLNDEQRGRTEVCL